MKKPKLIAAALVLLLGAVGAVMPKPSAGSHGGSEMAMFKGSKGGS
jgi:hypothetical protein